MSGEIYKVSEITENERVCITQYEQKEYDSCTWENEDFGKKFNSNLQMLCGFNNVKCWNEFNV